MDETVYRLIIRSLRKLLSSSSFREVCPKGHVFVSPHAVAAKAVPSDLAYVQGEGSVPGGRNEKPVVALGASHIVQTRFSSMKYISAQSVSSNYVVLVEHLEKKGA